MSCSERFWEKVDMSVGAGSCWLWTASRLKKGYGQFHCEGTTRRANVVAKELATGEAANGRLACHSCDNPPCCNPDHIFWGDPKSNSEDMVAKGRSMQGEKHFARKLTNEQVLMLRAQRHQKPQRVLAKEFGVSQSVVSEVLRKVAWGHVR